MKKIKLILALTVCMISTAKIASAQTAGDSSAVNIPESYMSTQEQLQEDGTAGVATYNIDENKPAVETGAAEWRAQDETEELRVYSGRQDGNNYVKTIQVKVPVRNSDPYTYQPK